MLNERIIKDYSLQLPVEDMNKVHKTKAIFNQGDRRTSVIIVQLVNNKRDKLAIDLTECTILAKIFKTDETTSTILCSILDRENGVVAIGMTEQALLTIGENLVELEIQSGNQILYSPKMSYAVVDNLFDTDELIVSQDEFPVLNGLINTVQDIERELLVLDETLDTNEEARKLEEQTRKDNEVNRIDTYNNFKLQAETLVSDLTSKSQEIGTKISEANAKIEEVDSTKQEIVSTMDSYIEIFDRKLDAVDNKMQDVETTNTNNTKLINNKIDECNTKLTAMDNLKNNLTESENQRVTNETARTQKFNSIVSELEVTQQDVDDIISMIGGL